MDRNDLLTASRAEFLLAFLKFAGDSIPLALKELYQKTDSCPTPGDRSFFLVARHNLQNRDGELILELKKNMEHLLQRSFQTTYSTFRPSFSSTYSSSSLSLIDASAFEDELRIKEMTNQFRNQAEDQLRDLNIRIALLFEQEKIEERENPFRPYLFARCITSAVEGLGESAEVSAILAQQLGESMIDGIDEIYSCVNAHLARNGIAAQLQLKISKSRTRDVKPVQNVPVNPHGGNHPNVGAGVAASQNVSPAAPLDRKVEQLLGAIQVMMSGLSNHPGLSHPTPAPQAEREAGQRKVEWLPDNQVLGDVLRKFFVVSVRGAPSGTATPSASGGDQKINDPMPGKAGPNAGLEGAAALSNSEMTQEINQAEKGSQDEAPEDELRNLILAFRASPEGARLTLSEQMSTDILAMLFEFILHDNLVPKAIRIQIGRLQLVILRIVLRDTSFLTQNNHPLRRLIDRFATIALGLQQLDPDLVHVTAEVGRIVDLLLEEKTEDATLVLNTLDDVDLFVVREVRDKPGAAHQAMQLADKALSLSRQFSPRPSLMKEALSAWTVDTYLRDFLENTWMPVIEIAEATDSAMGKRLRIMVPELLWSSVPKGDAQDRKQLFALLPPLLDAIRAGLALIGWTALQQQELLNWLVDVHTKALRVGNASQESPSLLATRDHFAKFIANPAPEAVPIWVEGDLSDDRTFLEAALRELHLEVRQLDPIFDVPPEDAAVQTDPPFPHIGLPDTLPVTATPTASGLKMDLRCGVPIEITLGMPQRGLLIWVSPHFSYVLLTLADDLKPSAISVKLFQYLLDSARVRFLEPAPLFERAVNSLLISADGIDSSANAR